MKIENQYLKNYIVHAISVLDLEMLKKIMRSIPASIKDKIEMNLYLHNFEMIFKYELDSSDTQFEVANGKCNILNCTNYVFTFTANSSRKNFTIKFIDSDNSMFFIEECSSNRNSKSIQNTGFNRKNIEAPF
jgi:hypothetical protein